MKQEVMNLFDQQPVQQAFDQIRISIASPEKILSWSYGEIKKPETINYRTFKPERDGLFCARIFGPIKDYECLCGKYKRMKYKGVICEKCGVEVTLARVRRERMGHIELAAPGRAHLVPEVAALAHRPAARHDAQGPRAHPLFRELRRHRAGPDPAQGPSAAVGRRVSPLRRTSMARTPSPPMIGAEAIREMLRALDLDQITPSLEQEIATTTSELKPKKLAKRLKIIEAFQRLGQQAGMDDHDHRPGDPAGSASAGAARRRPLRDVGPERPLSPRHQPQQPPEAADRAARAGHHHPQREADAAGSRSTRCSTTAVAAASSRAPTSAR